MQDALPTDTTIPTEPVAQTIAKPANPFAALSALSGAVKKVGIAKPEDVESVKKVWDESQMGIREELRDPARFQVSLKEGAIPVEFTVRGLSLDEKHKAEQIVEGVIPPKKTRTETKPGLPAQTVDDGYDEEAPSYKTALADANKKRLLFITLKGVEGLEEATNGDTVEEKMAELSKMNSKIVEFLASEIWYFSYSGQDFENFFFKKG
jgi:hypothetical protein